MPSNLESLISQFAVPGARLRLYEGPYEERPDVAERALHFVGNEAGFRSLSAALVVAINELEERLNLSSLPWVSSELSKPLTLVIAAGPSREPPTCGAVVSEEGGWLWRVTEDDVSFIASQIHGLGYAWNHLHLDPVQRPAQYSVCCYLE